MSEHLPSVFLEGLHQLSLGTRGEEEVLLSRAFLRYRQELLAWNAHTNLTAITDPEHVLLKHFLDSLSLLAIYDEPIVTLLDIGTGPGFPGLPLKIARPQWHVTLLEATGKKIQFLRHIIDTLQLTDIEVIHGRAEEYAHKREYRAAFDVVTARAVSALPALLESSAPFCRVGGYIILPKKGDLSQELLQGKRTASQVGARFVSTSPVTLDGLDDGRCILLWEQQKACPPQFPRTWAAMIKKPLG